MDQANRRRPRLLIRDRSADSGIDNQLALRIVPTDKVIPHENTDPRRVTRLMQRLEEDNILANPPVVIELDDRYVVLDGATRVEACKQMQLPHLLVQVASFEAGLELKSWYHVIRQIELSQLEAMLNAVSGVSLRETDRRHVHNEMVEYGGLCFLHTAEDKIYLVEAEPGVSKLEALNNLTRAYIETSYVARTLDHNFDNLRDEYPDMAALVVFCNYTIEQILQIVHAGHVVPAGITRFIIPGRVLRVNLDLDYLKSDEPLPAKNKWLRQMVIEKLGNSQARYYAESVYLMDE